MKFKLEIDSDNDEFSDGYHSRRAIVRILKSIASKIDNGSILDRIDGAKIMDVNGNSIGEWEFKVLG